MTRSTDAAGKVRSQVTASARASLTSDIVEAPDIALEIVVTSGGIDRLTVYRGVGVQEVWIFRDGGFRLHALDGDYYRVIDRSVLGPGLDFGAMAELVAIPDQHPAVKAFRDRLRAALPTE